MRYRAGNPDESPEYAARCGRVNDHDVSAADRFSEASVDDADPA